MCLWEPEFAPSDSSPECQCFYYNLMSLYEILKPKWGVERQGGITIPLLWLHVKEKGPNCTFGRAIEWKEEEGEGTFPQEAWPPTAHEATSQTPALRGKVISMSRNAVRVKTYPCPGTREGPCLNEPQLIRAVKELHRQQGDVEKSWWSAYYYMIVSAVPLSDTSATCKEPPLTPWPRDRDTYLQRGSSFASAGWAVTPLHSSICLWTSQHSTLWGGAMSQLWCHGLCVSLSED